jgi:Transglutaminase-like superfamily
MWERLRRFKALEPRARGLFLRATALLPIISLSLRVRGFRATQLRLQRYLSDTPPAAFNSQLNGTDRRAALTAQMVRSAAHWSIGKATCLEQSLALWWLLGRQGIASSMRIGTRKAGEKFEAHAWVECRGVALNEAEQPHLHYAVFDESFPILDPAKK